MEHPQATRLTAGIRDLGLDLAAPQQDCLLCYLDLLVKWNEAYNLTAVREPGDMVTRHLLDSLAVGSSLTGRRILDVGTGAGLPGVPLAILYPEREFHLLDSNGKKTRFLFQVKTRLRLDNMVVHHTRVESFRPGYRFDVILSRAFASLVDMVTVCAHLLAPDGVFLAMKGVYPRQELEAVAELYDLKAVRPLQIPGLGEQRHLVVLGSKRRESE